MDTIEIGVYSLAYDPNMSEYAVFNDPLAKIEIDPSKVKFFKTENEVNNLLDVKRSFQGTVYIYLYHPDTKELIYTDRGTFYTIHYNDTFDYAVVTPRPEITTIVTPPHPIYDAIEKSDVYNPDTYTWTVVEDHRKVRHGYNNETDEITDVDYDVMPYFLPLDGDTGNSDPRYMDTFGPYPERAAIVRHLPFLEHILIDLEIKNAKLYHNTINKLIMSCMRIDESHAEKIFELSGYAITDREGHYINTTDKSIYLQDVFDQFYQLIADIHNECVGNNLYQLHYGTLVNAYARLWNKSNQQTVINYLLNCKNLYGRITEYYNGIRQAIYDETYNPNYSYKYWYQKTYIDKAIDNTITIKNTYDDFVKTIETYTDVVKSCK